MPGFQASAGAAGERLFGTGALGVPGSVDDASVPEGRAFATLNRNATWFLRGPDVASFRAPSTDRAPRTAE
jgi:hypothetical protein